MLIRLLLLFTVVPLVELWLLLRLHDLTSLGVTLGLVILTGIVGAALAKRQGLATLGRIRDELGAGRMPTTALQDGLLILLAGALLVTPGLLTDAFGFSLLFPPARRRIREWLGRRWRRSFQVRAFQFESQNQPRAWNDDPTPQHRDKVIDVQILDPPKGPAEGR